MQDVLVGEQGKKELQRTELNHTVPSYTSSAPRLSSLVLGF